MIKFLIPIFLERFYHHSKCFLISFFFPAEFSLCIVLSGNSVRNQSCIICILFALHYGRRLRTGGNIRIYTPWKLLTAKWCLKSWFSKLTGSSDLAPQVIWLGIKWFNCAAPFLTKFIRLSGSNFDRETNHCAEAVTPKKMYIQFQSHFFNSVSLWEKVCLGFLGSHDVGTHSGKYVKLTSKTGTCPGDFNVLYSKNHKGTDKTFLYVYVLLIFYIKHYCNQPPPISWGYV